jgi:sensor c-di-GMP phosphodiesterase-like protein
MRYQGIVPLDGDSLAECLEAYFASSEQLPTRVRLAANGDRSVGLLLQKLPEPGGVETEEGSPSALAWQDAQRGVAAIRSSDLVSASLQPLLEERFGQRDVRVFQGSPVEFSCRCSQARVAGLLRSLGIAVALDDFGRSGTSLSALRRLPISAVKLDPSLAPDLSRQNAVPKAMAQLSRALGLRVVVKGVETMAQLRGAREIQADAVQGIAIARPMSAEDVTDLLTLRLPRDVRLR